jgi:signal transduction histidine kinase
MAYENIDGVKYEKELLDLARKHTTGRGEGKLSKDEVADLFKSANDGQGVTETEKRTLEYIRKRFVFTDAAAKDFDHAFARLG